ncbi:MAG: hypothetical protein JWM59_1125 [Verrucomicrobiales bacterium]|nr:hypothetical protein [Verrucomicrobiales bacterium]
MSVTAPLSPATLTTASNRVRPFWSINRTILAASETGIGSEMDRAAPPPSPPSASALSPPPLPEFPSADTSVISIMTPLVFSPLCSASTTRTWGAGSRRILLARPADSIFINTWKNSRANYIGPFRLRDYYAGVNGSAIAVGGMTLGVGLVLVTSDLGGSGLYFTRAIGVGAEIGILGTFESVTSISDGNGSLNASGLGIGLSAAYLTEHIGDASRDAVAWRTGERTS